MNGRKINLAEAIRIQQELARRLILEWPGGEISFVAGADFSYSRTGERIAAVIVVMKIPEFDLVEVASALRKVDFPYIPGFLSFREVPAFEEAFQRIRCRPDVTLLDGNGIAHPRRMGLASHAGVLLDIPTVGCAKSAFFPFKPPPLQRGAYTLFKDRNQEKVGFCLRTRTSVKPVFVSPGHRIDFPRSRRVVLASSRFRIPEPLRQAHLLSRQIFSP
ncbi:MAG: endonuclease V [Candidatus Aminicenantales bacterium]